MAREGLVLDIEALQRAVTDLREAVAALEIADRYDTQLFRADLGPVVRRMEATLMCERLALGGSR